MATLMQSALFARDPLALSAVTAGLASAAVSIANEDPGTPNHDQRVMLAHRVLNSPEMVAQSMIWAVASNATVVDKWMDGQVESAIGDLAFVIASIWDAAAG